MGLQAALEEYVVKSKGLQSISGEDAADIVRTHELGKGEEVRNSFAKFIETRAAISKDDLRMWWELSQTAETFAELLEVYSKDEDESWPTLLDSFVDAIVKPEITIKKAATPRPATGPEEAEQYKAAYQASLPMKEGHKWYIVEANWAHKWRDYSGFHPLEFRTPTVTEFAMPIDNSPLLTGDVIPRTKREDQDFVLMPQACWEMLFGWYGGGPELARNVFQERYSRDCKIEIWPYNLRLQHRSQGVLYERQVSVSRMVTVRDIRARAHDEFKLTRPVTDVLIYDQYDWLINDLDQTLLESVFTDGSIVSVKLRFLSGSGAGSGTGSVGSNYSDHHEKTTPGLAGLQNIGNTCFMNSALQCLSHTPKLREFFVSGKYEADLNEVNPLGTKGQLARAFAYVLQQLWSGNVSSHRPSEFKAVLARFAPQFSGWQQQDSQELLAFLLDGVHEDLNRVKQKEFVESKASDGRPDEVVAVEAWGNHLKRNQSIIVDLFHGQLKSTIECPTCDKISITFDPFMYLSIPLQTQPDSSVFFEIIVFPYADPYRHALKYRVKVSESSSVGDIQREAAKLCGVPKASLLLADVFSFKVHAFLEQFKSTADISSGDTIVGYEVPNYEEMASSSDKRKEHIKVTITQMRAGEQWGYVLLPLVFVLPKTTTNKQLHELVWERVKEVVPDYQPTEEKPLPFDIYTEPYYCDICRGYNCRGCLVKPEEEEGVLAKSTVSLEAPSGKSSSYYRKEHVHLYMYWHRGLLAEKQKWPVGEHESMTVATEDNLKKDRQQCSNLSDCMNLFSSKERLGENDMWYCPNCKEHKQASKQMELWSLPEYLVVHLKRFSYTSRWGEKLDHLVRFPLQGLDVAPWMVRGAPAQNTIYDLYAVSVHSGGTYGGHYTANALVNGKWMDFNDSWVSPASEQSIVSRQAYLLFYKKRGADDAPAAGVPSAVGEAGADDDGADDNAVGTEAPSAVPSADDAESAGQ